MTQPIDGEMQAPIAIPVVLLRYPQLATRYTTALQNVNAWKSVRERDVKPLPKWVIDAVARVLGTYWFLVPQKGLLAKLEQLRTLRAKMQVISKRLPVVGKEQSGDSSHVLIEPAAAKVCLKMFEELALKKSSQECRDALGDEAWEKMAEGLKPLLCVFARDRLKTDCAGRVIVQAQVFKLASAALVLQIKSLNHIIKRLDPSDKPFVHDGESA
ncbi:hypothetical protein [Cobetia marina]|uniref:hypothetical protein n=1 Tax=Cobetia marina TaxID=28258 RepID=UPI003A8CEF13